MTLKKVVLKTVLAVIFCLTSQLVLALDLPFIHDGKLNKSQIEKGKNTALNIAADRIIDRNQQFDQLLITEKPNQIGTDRHVGVKLRLVNTKTWSVQDISDGVFQAKLSPKGNALVVWNDEDTINVVNLDGDVLLTLGIHGAAPMYSHTGNLIAYQKLADSSDDESEPGSYEVQGIAVYDLKSNTEKLVTFDAEDFAPVGFSNDESKLFFNSARAYPEEPGNHIASLWVVDINSGSVERLTNQSVDEVKKGNFTPILSSNSIWSSDRQVALSSVDSEDGTWKYQFAKNGKLISAEHFADGDSPQWVEKDRIVASKVSMAGKVHWHKFNVR
jgi:hypothetical protein